MYPLQLFCFWLQIRERQIYAQTRAASNHLGQGQGWNWPALLSLRALSAPSWAAARTVAFKKPPEKWPQDPVSGAGGLAVPGIGLDNLSGLSELAGDQGETPPPTPGLHSSCGHPLKVALASPGRQVTLSHLPSTGSPACASSSEELIQLLKCECPPCILSRTRGKTPAPETLHLPQPALPTVARMAAIPFQAAARKNSRCQFISGSEPKPGSESGCPGCLSNPLGHRIQPWKALPRADRLLLLLPSSQCLLLSRAACPSSLMEERGFLVAEAESWTSRGPLDPREPAQTFLAMSHPKTRRTQPGLSTVELLEA